MIKSKKPLFYLLLLFFLMNSNVFGAAIPKSFKYDKRITYTNYNASDVFVINAKNGYVSVLEFSSDERIVNIATGFANGWELIDRENYLFIKPKAYIVDTKEQNFETEKGDEVSFPAVIQPNSKDWKTNLIVTTNKRFYSFDLILNDENSTKINYKVEFKYPTDKQKLEDAQKLAYEKKMTEEQNKTNINIALNKTTIPRNWDFLMHINKGSDTIAPDFAYDDGVFTYLGFNNTKTIPSVFLYDEANEESILNSHLKKDGKYDVLVIHKTAQKILLRSGKKLVGIFNQGYAKNPLDKTYTTTNKKVIREIIDE